MPHLCSCVTGVVYYYSREHRGGEGTFNVNKTPKVYDAYSYVRHRIRKLTDTKNELTVLFVTTTYSKDIYF